MKTMSEEDETLDGCGCDMSSAKGKRSSAYNKAWSWRSLLSFHFCLLDSAWSMRCCVDLCFRVLKRLVSSIPPIKKKKKVGGGRLSSGCSCTSLHTRLKMKVNECWQHFIALCIRLSANKFEYKVHLKFLKKIVCMNNVCHAPADPRSSLTAQKTN